MQVTVPPEVPLGQASEKFRRTEGVRKVYAYSEGWLGDRRKNPVSGSQVTVGDCASLREVAVLSSCRDGDVFAALGAENDADTQKLAKAGRTLYFEPSYDGEPKSAETPWVLPSELKQARALPEDPTWAQRGGFLITPKALPAAVAPVLSSQVYLKLDESVPDVRDRVRNTAAAFHPLSEPMVWQSVERADRYTAIRSGLFVGAACVLALIGASLLVSQLEQLRERKKLLSSLVAFGTRRRTLGLSVLWQTAIPIALGLLLASAVGLTLGTVLLRMTDTTVRVDWPSVLSMTGVGAAVVLVVTLLSLPPLLRLMRPDGLRTE